MTEVTRYSCWHQNFVPKGFSAFAPGLYTCIKAWKKKKKKMTGDKRFLLTSKFCPLGLSAPDLRLYTFIKSWKDVYKVRGWRETTIVMRPSCWHKSFGPNGLSAPAQGLCLNFFSAITADFNISSARRWAIQDQWSSGSYCRVNSASVRV